MEREDGEMSDDSSMQVDDEKSIEPVFNGENNPTVLYKADRTGIQIQQLEKVDASKLKKRAERFGLTGNGIVTQEQIDKLYTNFGIETGNERHFRFDTLHLNGIGDLTTKEVFEYLEDYQPVSLERVGDNSCNVVFHDHITAALVLLVHCREIKNEDINSMLSENSSHYWKEGMPHPKTDFIFIRFATNGDEKVVKKHRNLQDDYDQAMSLESKNPWGDLCRSWGVYDHQEIFMRKLPKHDYEDAINNPKDTIQVSNKNLALRLGKRGHKVEQRNDSDSDSEWKQKAKAPRMRMHADDEESKQRKKQTQHLPSVDKDFYAPLSIEVINSQSTYSPRNATKLSDKFKSHTTTGQEKDSVRSRLGLKVVPSKETCSSDEYSSDTSEPNVMSRVQKVNNTINKTNSDVWSRLETKTPNSDVQHDLRQILKARKQNKADDLRARISKSKKSNLRIEIDNDL